MHAEKHYGAPYLKTKIFDVSQPPQSQGIGADDYDVVIATNVLHATEDIRQSLRNVKATLHNGGVLLLNESSCRTVFTHLTFGLLKGWWLYTDSELRIPGCPALHPQSWARVLQEEGFVNTVFLAQAYHHLGQQVIWSQSNGVVRQQREPRSQPPVTTAPMAESVSVQTPPLPEPCRVIGGEQGQCL